MTELEKVDVIRERLGVSYNDAKRLLDLAGGSVVDALIMGEEEAKARQGDWDMRGRQVWEKIKELIRRGNVTRVRVKCDGKVFLEIPVTAGVVGALLAPNLAVIGALLGGVGLLMGKCSVEVDTKDQGTIVHELPSQEKPAD